jgi:hypothetical protein
MLKKSVFQFCCCFLLQMAQLEVSHAAEPVPQAKEWALTTEQSVATGEVLPFIQNIAFVSGFQSDGFPTFRALNLNRFNQGPYFRTYPEASLRWSLKLNRYGEQNKLAESEFFPSTVNLLQQIADFSLIVWASGDAKEWKIWVKNQNKSGEVFSKDAPEAAKNEDDLINWVNASLGYNAVILAEKAGIYLVKAPAHKFRKGVQGVVFDSRSPVVLRNDKPIAILELVNSHAQYGVFKVILKKSSNASLQRGSKVFISE